MLNLILCATPLDSSLFKKFWCQKLLFLDFGVGSLLVFSLKLIWIFGIGQMKNLHIYTPSTIAEVKAGFFLFLLEIDEC